MLSQMESQGVAAAKRVGQVARAMLDGSLHYLVGALELEQLRHELGAYENDPDFIAFIAVKMDVESIDNTDQLLIDLDHLSQEESDTIEASVNWAKSISLMHCQALADRYN